MSKVALSGNALGTGTVTLAAPNTNSTVTLNLPAVNGTLNTSGATNEVPAGTVSAPSIFPTGDTNTGIFFPAADTIAFTEGGVESMRIDASGNVGIGTSSPYSFSGAKTLQLTAADYSLLQQSVTASTANNGNWRQIVRGSIGSHVYQLQLMNDANSAEQSVYEVSRSANSVSYQRWFGGASEAMRIDSSGRLLVGTQTNPSGLQDNGFAVVVAGAGAGYFVNNSISSAYTISCWNKATSGDRRFIRFNQGSSETIAGEVYFNGTVTVYGTTSDYRLKEITGAVTAKEAKDFIMALQPKQGTWKADGSKFVGFLAHEFQEVAPSSVSGKKDAVDKDNKPEYQVMQAASAEVMANLIALVQELTARLEVLENK